MLGAILWPTLNGLHALWLDSFTYSHGYLVVVLAIVLLAAQWRRNPTVRAAPSGPGLIALAAAITVSLAGRASDTLILSQAAVPLVLWAAIWTAVGWRNARQYFWPLAYLYFAIPFWDVLTEPLRQLTTTVVSWCVRLAGIPAFIQGNVIQIPSGAFEVAGGCSGLHYLIVGLALSGFYGLFYYRRWRSRLILGIAALLLSLVANWLRVFTLVAVGHWSEMQHYLIVEDHYVFGWVLFLIVFAPILWLAQRLEANEVRASGIPRDAGLGMGIGNPRRPFIVIAAAVVLASGLWLGQRIQPASNRPALSATVELPDVEGWQRAESWADPRLPRFAGPAGEAAAWYRSDRGTVGAYVAQYPFQTQGRELIFYANRPQGNAAQIVRRARAGVTPDGARRLRFLELEVADAPDATRLLWLGMQVAGYQTTSPVLGKVYQALGVALGRTDAQAIVLSVPCAASCDQARALLEEFAVRAAERLYASARGATLASGTAPP